MTLEQVIWRIFVGYHCVTFVVFVLLGTQYLLAWGISVLLTHALNRRISCM